MKLVESLTHTPVQLGFGTSGLRGLVTDMTDLECYINTIGFLNFLASKRYDIKGAVVYVAGDLRDSTPRIMRSVSKAIVDVGGEVEYCGLIPTPAVAYYAGLKKAACIMVTGSHIPADRNGIKFYKPAGEVLKEDEASIKSHVAEARQQIYSQEAGSSDFDSEGALVGDFQIPELNSEAKVKFMERFNVSSNQPLKNKHIVVYQHSAVGRDLMVSVLENLGAQVTKVGRSDIFVPIDTENVTPDNKAYFRSLAEEFQDNFAIVSTDGDSDRPFMIDETGEFHRGDVLGCVVAKEVQADFAALPISCNDAANSFLLDNGIKVVNTKIGSPYVITAMQDAASAKVKVVVGWEVNGGFMHNTAISLEGCILSPLPTRDAFLPIIAVLLLAAREDKKISEVFAMLPKRYTGAGLLDNVDPLAIEKIREVTKSPEVAKKLVEEYLQSKELGVPTEIDTTDGLRVKFDSGNIVHLRPSGNAPQLRIYTNTDTQEYADRLAVEAVAPGALLEQFVEAVARI